jgi:hypothetical protein
VPLDPYGPQKATIKAELKSGHKGKCAVCEQQKTLYAAKVYPEGRPWQALELCSDCIARVQRVQLWPLPPEA